jgi:hypothetical protein
VKPDDSAHAQEVALLLKAMQDECELHAVTRVGSQQIAGALGLLPGRVAVPQWLQSGMGSFFETPRGAYRPGTASPHWKYFINFRNWRDEKKLEKPDEVLFNIITDKYFTDARQSNDPAAWEKAHTMAWALTYFLAQDPNMREGFLRYLDELAQLPRDMDLDGSAYMLCFLRAFNLGGSKLSGLDDAAITAAMKKVSKDWYYEYMSRLQLDITDAWTLSKKIESQRAARLAELEAERKRNAALPPGVGPGGEAGGPGAPPGGPGAGPGPGAPPGPGGPPRRRQR